MSENQDRPSWVFSKQFTALFDALFHDGLPLLAEHGLMAVRGSGLPSSADNPMTKEEAAEFLGIGLRKLEM